MTTRCVLHLCLILPLHAIVDICLVFEHERLLFLLVQVPLVLPPPGVEIPSCFANVHSLIVLRIDLASHLIDNIGSPTWASCPPAPLTCQAIPTFTASTCCRTPTSSTPSSGAVLPSPSSPTPCGPRTPPGTHKSSTSSTPRSGPRWRRSWGRPCLPTGGTRPPSPSPPEGSA